LLRLSYKITPQMILLSRERQRSLAPTNDRHGADRLIRFAVLSRIDILHVLLEHSYDSQRKLERWLSSPTLWRQLVAKNQDLFSPLRQFQRRPAVVVSVAKLLDIQMLTMHTGRERTRAEYAKLLAEEKFRLERVIETPSGDHLAIARPKVWVSVVVFPGQTPDGPTGQRGQLERQRRRGCTNAHRPCLFRLRRRAQSLVLNGYPGKLALCTMPLDAIRAVRANLDSQSAM
jgi:hypothetical protein